MSIPEVQPVRLNKFRPLTKDAIVRKDTEADVTETERTLENSKGMQSYKNHGNVGGPEISVYDENMRKVQLRKDLEDEVVRLKS